MIYTLPEKFYILYNNKEEFGIIVKYFHKDWRYYEINEERTYAGYTNYDQNVCNNWVSSNNGHRIEELKEKDYIEVPFNEFNNYIVNKLTYNLNYDYLIPFINKLK